MRGYIYILHSIERPGIVKVGRTTTLPKSRCKDLNKEWYLSINTWEIHAWFWVENCIKAERDVHKALRRFNLKAKKHREAFKISPGVASDISERICAAYPAKSQNKLFKLKKKQRHLENIAANHVKKEGPYKDKILSMYKDLNTKDFYHWMEEVSNLL
jgi:hypothetical protein